MFRYLLSVAVMRRKRYGRQVQVLALKDWYYVGEFLSLCGRSGFRQAKICRCGALPHPYLQRHGDISVVILGSDGTWTSHLQPFPKPGLGSPREETTNASLGMAT
jgi:hypothetical protein